MPPKIPIPRCLLISSYPLRPQCLTYNPSFHPTSPTFLLPHRTYANPPQKKSSSASTKRRPQRTSFRQYPLKDADQYSLSEAMQYLQAFEVGQDPVGTKYELAIKLHAMKNGPTIKTRVKLPKPVKTDMKICVIAEGPVAEAALKAGADTAGTTEVFELIKTGKFNFTHLIAHDESYPLLTKARLGQILGPKGLMPSPKMGNVVSNPVSAIRELTGKADYRERLGVIRVAVGQLGFTEQELAKNISTFMESVKKEIGILAGKTEKGIIEVVLSTTRGPGFSLNGAIRPSKETEAQPVQAAVATA